MGQLLLRRDVILLPGLSLDFRLILESVIGVLYVP